jgi:sensor histidine kinase YesM
MDDFFSRFVLSDQLPYRVGRHVLFWVVCWLFMGFIYGFYYIEQNKRDFSISYTESFLFLPQHMLLSYGIIYFVLPRYIFKSKYWKGLAAVFSLIILAAILSPVILNLVIAPVREAYSLPVRKITIFHSFMGGLRGSMTIAGFAVAIKLVKYWYFKKAENEILEKEKLKAELALLRGQLQPHFIFNTLNSIYSLSIKKSEHTSEAILKLSELMRYMVSDCNGSTIPLAKEVQSLRNFIELGKTRFRERIDITTNIAGNFENKKIAPLIFLPFLENSFKYGTNEMLEHAWISLDLTVKGNSLKFKLINGKSPQTGDVKRVSSGIGLQNVKKRLDMLYPSAYELRINETEDTFMVQLSLQLEKIKLADTDEENKLPVSR